MPRTKKKITAQNKKPEPGRNANGMGSLRQKTVKGNIYWEGRYSVIDPVTGKSVQRSISGKDQAEVYAKMIKAQTEINEGTYIEPSKMTVGEWLDIWLKTYLNGVRPYTILNYAQHVNNHIKTVFGKVKLDKLNTHMIQQFYNDLGTVHGNKPGLSPKTVKCIHGIFHKALQQAIEIGYLRSNPTTACKLPKVERKEVKSLDNEAIQSFIKAIRGHRFEVIFLVTLCTGLRRGEVCGLTWDSIDLERGTIHVNKQLQQVPGQSGNFRLTPTKNGKSRTITVASFVVDALRQHKSLFKIF